MLLDEEDMRHEAVRDGKARILVVDDLPGNLVVLRTLLEELDQHLVLARSGREALRAVLQHEFAVILLDVNMPDIDGLETASLIRQNRRSAHTPIIFITAFADEIQTKRGYSLGAVDYILSPVVPDILRSKVKVFVDLYIMRQRLRYQADERVALAAAESARKTAEANASRLTFLLRASKALAESLDIEKGIQELLDLIVPEYAGFAAIALLDETGQRTRVLRRISREGGADAVSTADVLSDRAKPSLMRAVESRRRIDLAAEEFASWLGEEASRVLSVRAAELVPLMTGERPLGALMVASERGAPDWLMLEELANHASVSLENAYLYQRLQAEIDERRQIETKLQEASARKDEFLAMLSHELRNPLTPISAAVEVIRQVAPDDPRLVWATDVTARQLDHLVYLVDELLDAARISRGKIVLKSELVNLVKVIEHGIETAGPLIAARNHTLTQRLPDGPIWLRGDFARLSQVVSNLLNNAAKYTEDGGRIYLELSVENDEAVIVVRDNGMGIECDLLPNVFDLFKQGKRSLDRRQGGLGIGLTVVKRLIELHRGVIGVRSAGAGKGAEFFIRLPCLRELAGHIEAAEKADETPQSRSCRILVVDDNKDGADAIGMILRLSDYEVKEVGDGMQALECLNDYAPAVVILDIGLPLLDGYEVARLIRAQPRHKDTLLIALTGYGQRWDQQHGMEVGFDLYFVKPASPYLLLEAIAKWQASTASPTAAAIKGDA